MGGCLGDSFILAIDFLRADRVGYERGSAGVVLTLTAGVLGEPCSPGVMSRSLIGGFISSITGGDHLEDSVFLCGFWVP